jgi:hypothetical protein
MAVASRIAGLPILTAPVLERNLPHACKVDQAGIMDMLAQDLYFLGCLGSVVLALDLVAIYLFFRGGP